MKVTYILFSRKGLGINRQTYQDEDESGRSTPQASSIIEPTTSSLASSLVSTVKTASRTSSTDSGSGRDSTGSDGTLGINKDDTKLLEDLFHSLGQVCMELQEITAKQDHDQKMVRVLRRRLDAARRVLDGELDA